MHKSTSVCFYAPQCILRLTESCAKYSVCIFIWLQMFGFTVSINNRVYKYHHRILSTLPTDLFIQYFYSYLATGKSQNVPMWPSSKNH